jgi:hypothetical protein
MPDKQLSQFAHRPNVDGTFDSICRHCFYTVVRSERESELDTHEQRHTCDGLAFNERQAAIHQLELR